MRVKEKERERERERERDGEKASPLEILPFYVRLARKAARGVHIVKS